MRRALIVGVTGFAGPYLAAELRSQDVDCAGLSRAAISNQHPISLEGVRLHDVDIRDRHAVTAVLQAERPDWVFHLASISHVPTTQANPELTFDVNVAGFFNVLEGLRTLNRPSRIVFTSSGSVYGNVDSGEKGFDEEWPTRPASPYATSKLMGEQLARSFADDFGLDVIVARPFNHTGPGQSPSFACPAFAQAIAKGIVHQQRVNLKTGRLDPLRDISDIRDVVRAYVLLAESGRAAEVYNVSSGSMTSMRQVLDRISALARVEVTTKLDPDKMRPHEIMRSGGDSSKIRRELGWRPEISLDRTLGDLLDYWVRLEQSGLDHPM